MLESFEKSKCGWLDRRMLPMLDSCEFKSKPIKGWIPDLFLRIVWELKLQNLLQTALKKNNGFYCENYEISL
jgi:hypothetical protein